LPRPSGARSPSSRSPAGPTNSSEASSPSFSSSGPIRSAPRSRTRRPAPACTGPRCLLRLPAAAAPLRRAPPLTPPSQSYDRFWEGRKHWAELTSARPPGASRSGLGVRAPRARFSFCKKRDSALPKRETRHSAWGAREQNPGARRLSARVPRRPMPDDRAHVAHQHPKRRPGQPGGPPPPALACAAARPCACERSDACTGRARAPSARLRGGMTGWDARGRPPPPPLPY